VTLGLTSRAYIENATIEYSQPPSFRAVALDVPDKRLSLHRFWRRLLGFLLNIGLFMVLFQAYKLVRRSFIQRGETLGYDHAEQILRLENRLHVGFELDLQRWVLSYGDWFVRTFNLYYFYFMPLFYVCCGLSILFAPVQWRFWRNVFLSSMMLALPWYALYPLAPPRFMTDYGFIDTSQVFGPNYFASNGAIQANRYAAMPSMHVGWSTIGALMLIACLPRIRGFPIGVIPAVFHVTMMTMTVMITGNHYFLDAVAGWIIVALSILMAWKVFDRLPFGLPRWLNPT
jgi:membrane-associated phospholipid phosphatase